MPSSSSSSSSSGPPPSDGSSSSSLSSSGSLSGSSSESSGSQSQSQSQSQSGSGNSSSQSAHSSTESSGSPSEPSTSQSLSGSGNGSSQSEHSSGASSNSSASGSPTIKVERIWSNQLPDRECNLLPGNSGDAEHDYIMMGIQANEGPASIKAEVSFSPDSVRNKLRVAIATNLEDVGSYGTVQSLPASSDVVTLEFGPSGINTDKFYRVIVWIDSNDDDVFDPNDHYDFPM